MDGVTEASTDGIVSTGVGSMPSVGRAATSAGVAVTAGGASVASAGSATRVVGAFVPAEKTNELIFFQQK